MFCTNQHKKSILQLFYLALLCKAITRSFYKYTMFLPLSHIFDQSLIGHVPSPCPQPSQPVIIIVGAPNPCTRARQKN